MGAGQSTPSLSLPGAGERELNTPGVFVLAANQRKFVDSMAVLLKVLLTEATNLGDLKELLKKSCSSLFMVNTGDPYTQMRLLQDPVNPQKSRVLTVVPKEAYKTKYEVEQRHMAMCTQYTGVLLRLTEVVLALFASIYINQGMAALKDLPNKVESLQRNAPDGQSIPMPSAILENYKSEGFFQEIEPNLYIFKPRPEVAGAKTPNPPHMVVFDVAKGLIYYAGSSDNKGPVFRFTFSEKPVARGVGSQIQPFSGQSAYNPGYGFAFPRPPQGPSIPVGVAPQYMPPTAGSGQLLITNPSVPSGGPSGPAGPGGAMTIETAYKILGFNFNEPLTQALVEKAHKATISGHPNHGGSGEDMKLKKDAWKFLKVAFNKLENVPSKETPMNLPLDPASDLVSNPTVVAQIENPLFQATLSQELANEPPKNATELKQRIQDTLTSLGGVSQADIDQVKNAFAQLPLDYRNPSAITEALVDTFASQVADTAVLQPFNEDTLIPLIHADSPDEEQLKLIKASTMMNYALDNNRVGELIAARKRNILMKRFGKIKTLPNGAPATCLPLKPSGHDINSVTTALLDIKDTRGVQGGDLSDVFETTDGDWNTELEKYMRSVVKAKVIVEWPHWEKANPNFAATRTCNLTDLTAIDLGALPRRSARTRRGRRVQRRRRSTRRVQRRPQRGGDIQTPSDYYILTIDTFPKSERSYQVVLTTQGVAMNPADIRNPNPTSTSKSLTDLFMKVILAESVSAGSTVASKFRPLDASDVGTYGKLMNIYETVMNVQEGPSLGAYRAFSLLSAVESGLKSSRAYTYVCKDKMAGRRAGNEVQYSTLESLYLDVQETEKPDREQKGKDKLREVVNELTNTRYTSAPGSTPTTLNDISIPSLITDPMQPLCDAQGVVLHSANVAALKKGHQTLRRLYDSHLSAVYSFIMKEFITIRASDKMILLNQKLAFPTNGEKITTIQKKLEDLVEKARSMISSYYIKVEKEYTATLAGLTAPY